MTTEDENITEGEETGPPDQFVGRDLLESFMYYLNYVPSNPLERYNILVKSVVFGMELLPNYDDPYETDPDMKQKNKEKQSYVDKIYTDAKEALKNEVPAKREITYDYVDATGGEPIQLYKIKASEDKDAKECRAKEKELSTVLNNFITQQHEQHIPKLQMVHIRILHELTQAGIVPSINPPLEEMIKDEIKSLHREITDIMIAKQEEEKEEEEKENGKREGKI
ncbi:MAG TPA: hypothetical protein VMZ04_05205 [Anaerolineae bacterium]|nr:hypothetical protein [Anaerolineae bacterium]